MKSDISMNEKHKDYISWKKELLRLREKYIPFFKEDYKSFVNTNRGRDVMRRIGKLEGLIRGYDLSEKIWKNRLAKSVSSLSKDINRLKKSSQRFRLFNEQRKYQIRLFNIFINKLIKDKRIDKYELKPFMPKKRDYLKSREEGR